MPEIASQPVWEMLQRVYRTGETVEGKEMRILFARYLGGEPEERYFNFIYQACYEGNEGVTGVLVVAYEVTELVMARKAVEESQRRFHTLLEASPQLIWTARPDGYLDYFNQRAEMLSGRKSDQLQGEGWTGNIHPEDLPGLLEHWQHSIQTGEPYQQEARIRDKEGVYHWFLIRASARRDEQGNIAQWIGVAMDIHEKKILEERLRQLTQSLEENNQHLSAHNEEIQASNQRLHYINSDLDSFVYTASHDLRSPINSLNGLLQLLDESIKGKLQPEEQELVQHITTVLTKLNRTILDLTNISQEQQGGVREAIDFQDIFQDVKVDLQPLIAQAQARIEAHFEVNSLLYPRKHLRSIVYNLLSNAIKYRAPNRPCQVRINTFWQNDQVALSISDNGLGLDEQQQKKLFRAFRRLHYHVEGSGVGLYILKRIVDNNGGVIAVKSKKEVGTTFTVLFSKADTTV